MNSKNKTFFGEFRALYQNRHCYQEDVDVFLLGRKTNNICNIEKLLEFKGMDFKQHKTIYLRTPGRNFFKVVNNSYVYLVRGYYDDINSSGGNNNVTVDIYSKETNDWRVSSKRPDERISFCVCLFMQKLIVASGYDSDHNVLDTCYEYDVKSDKWSYVANVNTGRVYAACAVFDGQVVVSGGLGDGLMPLSSIEAYDHYENKWNFLPNMTHIRFCHSSVSMGNKLLVIGGECPLDEPRYSWEVFDKISNKFSIFQSRPERYGFNTYLLEGLFVGRKVLFDGGWSDDKLYLYVLDVDEKSWSVIKVEV